MSALSSKSEGYSSVLRDAAVPSTPLCCFIIFTILKFYNNITGLYGTFFTYAFFILFAVTLSLTAFRYRKFFKNIKSAVFYLSSLIIICCMITFFLKNKIHDMTDGSLFPENIENVSVTVDDINFKRYSTEIYFYTDQTAVGKLKGVMYYQGENTFNKGDSLFIHKKINRITADSENRFNNYLISKGIHYTAGLNDSDITVLKKNDVSYRAYLQKSLISRIDSLFKEPAAGLIKALLTGNQNYIQKKIIIQFRDSGVLHCLSASGLHVAIFAAIPAFLLIPFFRRNISLSVSLLSVIFYLLITDMPVPLLRAVIMFGLFYFQSLLFSKSNIFNFLMLTCSIILITSPSEIFSPGFQLSFAATAGILIFYRQYRRSLKSLPGFFADTTAVTLSAQLLTIPIIIFQMNQFNTAGLASNIIIIPLISLIMGISMFTILISFVSIPFAIISAGITGQIFKLTILITDFIYNLKLNFYIYNITPMLCILILISIIPLINYRHFTRLKFYPVLISAVLCTLYMKKNYQLNENIVITDINSKAEIQLFNNKKILKLNLLEGIDTEKIISEIKMKNPQIQIIQLCNNSTPNLLASKKILNDYIIDEYRFAGIPEISNLFKKIIFQLEKENVSVRYSD